MATLDQSESPAGVEIKLPFNPISKHFVRNKFDYYAWLRAEAPVIRGRVAVFNAYFVSRYDDCMALLADPRFVRNRTTATGGGRMPFPVPKSVAFLANSMITTDGDDHRRLRNLVHQAFTPRALKRLEERIERLTHELLDRAEHAGTVDLIPAYALPIPVTVISEMMGVSADEMPRFRDGLNVLRKGFSGWGIFRTFVWDLPRLVRFVRELIARKRADPQDDILSALIQAEEQGDRLSEDELISMVFLLIFAGHETTVHLIANAVITLLDHPDQLARLRSEPHLIDSAIEEILRFNGPIHGTKPCYPCEDVTLCGVTIPKGVMTYPLLASANRDEAAFADPDAFEITRTPNHHLGFGHGIHYCLGAPLARLETRIAITNLLERNHNLRLAVDRDRLIIQRVPLWHRYASLPVQLGK